MPRRAGDTREELVDAAMELFRQRGYNGTGVADIAKRVGITNAALYYHFRSKQELLGVVLERALRRHLDVLEEVVGSGLSAEGQLRASLDNHLDLIFDRPDAVRVFLRERRFLEGKFAETYQNQVKRYDELFDVVIARYLDGSGGDPSEARMLRFALLGMLNWITEWFRPGGEASEEEVRTIMTSLVIDRVLVTTTRPVAEVR